MKTIKYLVIIALTISSLSSCKKEEIDTEKPNIDISINDGFPQNCAVVYFDQPFTVKTLLTDNVELGAYNIDIHHNFDHHTHTTESETCPLAEIKTPVNPYIFIKDYSIPSGASAFETDVEITIPSISDGTEYEEGDYHFHLTVIDKEGWSSQIGLNIKILHQ